jgi:hypothetical protein
MSDQLSPEILAELRAIESQWRTVSARMREADELADVKAVRDRLCDAEVVALYRSYRSGIRPVPDPTLGRYVFAEVAGQTVDADVRKAAGRSIAWATADNRLPSLPELHWFVPETDADRAHVTRWGCRDWRWIAHPAPIDGLAIRDLGEVWLSAALDAAEAVRVAAHEARHLSQPLDMAEADAEVDAWAYAARLEGRIGAHHGA